MVYTVSRAVVTKAFGHRVRTMFISLREHCFVSFFFCVLNAIETLVLAEQRRKRCEEIRVRSSAAAELGGARARRKRAGCATHFGIRSPGGTALLFLVCICVFTSRSWRVFRPHPLLP